MHTKLSAFKLKLILAVASIVLLAVVPGTSRGSISSGSSSQSRCADVFLAPSAHEQTSRDQIIVSELASLKLAIESSKSNASTELAPVLYRLFFTKYQAARAAGVDLSRFNDMLEQFRRQARIEAERNRQIEKTARSAEHWIFTPWAVKSTKEVMSGGSKVFAGLSPDNLKVASLTENKASGFEVWSINDWTPTFGEEGVYVHASSFASTGDRFLVADSKDRLRIFSTASGAAPRLIHETDEFDRREGYFLPGTQFSADGRFVLAVRYTEVSLWDATLSHRLLYVNEHESPLKVVTQSVGMKTISGFVRGAGVSADGSQVMTATHRSVALWNTANGTRTKLIEYEGGEITAAALWPDGSMFALGDKNGKITFWDVATGKMLSEKSVHSKAVASLSVGMNGKILLTTSEDHTATVMDASSYDVLHPLAHQGKVKYIEMSLDGTMIVTVSQNPKNSFNYEIKIWGQND